MIIGVRIVRIIYGHEHIDFNMRFKKDDLQKNTRVGERSIIFNLPLRKVGKKDVFRMKNDSKFSNLLLESPNVHKVKYSPDTTLYEIIFKQCLETNLDLKKFVAECAAECEFN